MMMLDVPFVFESVQTRVVFGEGSAETLQEETRRADMSRAYLISGSPWQERALHLMGQAAVGVYDRPAQHTPVGVTEEALRHLESSGADGIVALGGGSAIGLGKALALRTGLALIAVPTTYAGSEMTPLLGQTEGGVKSTLKNEIVRPRVVIYDVNFTRTMPQRMSMASGLNAMAHAVEALYAPDGNPIISIMAREGIATMADGLKILLDRPDDAVGRRNALYGSWLCGHCLGAVSMGLHHKLCHTLGGLFDLQHADMHALMLPYSVAYNAGAVPEVMNTLTACIGGDPISTLREILKRSGLALALRELGMPLGGVDDAAKLVVKHAYKNPQEVTFDGIRSLLTAAWSGDDFA